MNNPTSPYPGLALKAWVLYTVAGGVATIVKSFNVTSVTRPGVGQTNITVTNAFSSATGWIADAKVNGSDLIATPSASSATIAQVFSKTLAGAATDPTSAFVAMYE